MAQNERGASPRARYSRSRRLGAGQGRPPGGGVWRKPNPHARGDEQEPERRGGAPGTSGHVTAKSSIRRGVLDTSGVYARNVRCLTLGDSAGGPGEQGLRAERSALSGQQTSAEGILGPTPARLVRHPKADRRGNREAKPSRGWAEGRGRDPQAGAPDRARPLHRARPAAGATGGVGLHLLGEELRRAPATQCPPGGGAGTGGHARRRHVDGGYRPVDDRPVWSGARLFRSSQGLLKSSWFTAKGSRPHGYVPVLDGVIFAHEESVGATTEVDRFSPTRVKNSLKWTDSATEHGLMLVIALPPGQTIREWTPSLEEAKAFGDRVAVFGPFPKIGQLVLRDRSVVSVRIDGSLDDEIERISRSISLARKRKCLGDYELALSFAGEDREYVDEVARALLARGVKVFYDTLEQVDLLGKNLYTHLSDVYLKRARFTVMFISRSYATKRWTGFEREAAQARAFAENREYILPVRIDDTDLPGMLPTVAYVKPRTFRRSLSHAARQKVGIPTP